MRPTRDLPPIESDVPVPGPYQQGTDKYGLSLLTPGQSRFFPTKDFPQFSHTTVRYQRKGGKTFTVRKREEDGVMGFRVWRVE